MNQSKSAGQGKFFVFGTLVVLALVAVSVIPSTMVYRLRLFDAIGLPEWMAEVLRVIIITATPLAVLATGLVRVFAVSDTEHAKQLGVAAVLEIISFVFEILAALVNGSDIFALSAQGFFLSIAIVAVSSALVITNSASGFYKMVIAHNEQTLSFQRAYGELFKTTMKTPEMQAAMVAAVTEQIKAAVTDQAGRELFQQDRLGIVPLNGERVYAATVEQPRPNA